MESIIFDLDGVICFTDHYHYFAWKELADHLGIPFDEQINNRLRGVSRMESLEIVLEKSPIRYTAEVSQEVRDTLEILRRKGLKLAIGSSSKNAQTILKQTGLENYFDAVSDGNLISKSKPDPEVFLKAAEMLKLSPQECVVMEDAFAGITAACCGGFSSIGIGDAAACPNATWHVRTFAEILQILT